MKILQFLAYVNFEHGHETSAFIRQARDFSSRQATVNFSKTLNHWANYVSYVEIYIC